MSITDGQISTRQWFMISGSVSVNHLFSLSNKVLHEVQCKSLYFATKMGILYTYLLVKVQTYM